MKNLLISAAAIALFAAPANAQLLGGGGSLGGMIGGSAGGVGSIGTPIRGTLDNVRSTVRSSTRGGADVTGSTEGGQKADVRSGSVDANRSANAGGTANVTQLVDNPIAPIGGSASGSGAAQGNGSANAQLLGTEAVAQTARNASSQVRDTANAARGLAMPTTGRALDAADSGSGSGSGMADISSAPLAAAGSAAAAGQGAFAVKPGMPIMSPEGARLGKVREVVADGRGQIEQIVMSAKGARSVIPAGDLTASGNGLILVEGEGSFVQSSSDKVPAE